MTLSCHGCGKQIPPSRGPGRQRKWCTERCRKQTLYAGACVDCGVPTNGYDGPGKASKRCVACAGADRKIWTRETIIAAIQAWSDETGGIPPTATDWNPSMARILGHPEKVEKFYADDAWPHVNTVQLAFGGWNKAIRAAGYAPRGPGQYGRDGEDIELCREIADRYAAGESPGTLAVDYGCSPAAIGYRVQRGGGKVRSRSDAARLRWQRARAAA